MAPYPIPYQRAGRALALDGPPQARGQRLERGARQHQLVALQDAIHVGALRRQHVHPGQVGRGQPQRLPAAPEQTP
jgi:hypothetical protein